MHTQAPHDLHDAHYAQLRTFRRDGTPVDTPIWFAVDDEAVLFRTKIGPKTKRLASHPAVELTACDYRGRRRPDATTVAGQATVLSGPEAEAANRLLHRRYGWQWNIMPMIKVPGVINVHRDLPIREKLRRARTRSVWPDSAIVRVELAPRD